MKNRILALVGLALFAAVSASAQNQPLAQVNVPFAFEFGSQQMPAGQYSIKHLNGTYNVIVLQGPGGANVNAMVRDEDAKTVPHQGYILFHQIGNRYFFAGIWSKGERAGQAIYPGSAEKEAMKSLNRTSSLTTLALNTIPAR
jgi:hypothetical protein